MTTAAAYDVVLLTGDPEFVDLRDRPSEAEGLRPRLVSREAEGLRPV